MDREFEAVVVAAATSGGESLRAGRDVGEVLRRFREDDKLGAIASILALRAIEKISLSAAKHLVLAECAGENFAHLGLAELQHLARIPHSPRINRWLPTHLQSAIIDGRPWRLCVPDAPGTVRYFEAPTPEPSRAGSMHGQDISFEWVRSEAMAALTERGWSDELRVVRDEPGLLLVHFARVSERA